MAERKKRKQPPGTDDEPLTPEQIARREIASEDLRWLAELLRRVRDKAEREMAEAEARGEVVRRYKIILRSHFPPRPREQCDPGNYFVVDSASGFWDGQGWTRHLEQALHFHDGEDPWAEARAVADELTRRGTPAEVSFVDPEKPEETPEEAQERIRREAEASARYEARMAARVAARLAAANPTPPKPAEPERPPKKQPRRLVPLPEERKEASDE